MRTRTFLIPLGALLLVGCNSQDRLKLVEDQVTDLKVEVFKLRTQMEESNQRAESERQASNTSREQDRRFQADLQETLRQVQDTTRVLNNRMGDSLQRRSSSAPRTAPAAAPRATGGEDAPSGGDDEKAFNAALMDYNRGNYALAADGFSLFLKAHPESSRCPDALYTQGLAFYNLNQFDKAQPLFERIQREYSSSSQFLPAKLKRGQCLLRQKLKPAAIKAFKEIVSNFPGTAEARTSQQELDELGF